MAERREPFEGTREELILDPWFAALRAEPAEPPLALLSAILADAAVVDEARNAVHEPTAVVAEATTPAPLPAADADEPRRRLSGWKAAVALAACAALGFWIGIDGRVTVEDGSVWTGTRAAAADSMPDDPVGAFFDLASAEG